MVKIDLAARLEGIDPFGENVLLDEGIMEALPAGCRVISTSRSGQSLWVETMRIEVELPDGSVQVFFKKGAAGAAGLLMVKGSFESEKTLYDFIPEYVARPVAFGTYKSLPDAHFYITDFAEMDEVPPNVKDWATCVSTLHARTMGKSPGGKFGFHANTHLGKWVYSFGWLDIGTISEPEKNLADQRKTANIPISKSWSSTWEECFSNVMSSLCDIEEQRRGPQDDWTKVKKLLFEVVIPRYLRPLQSEGRSIQPCLLHCDLWPGNTMPRSDSPDRLCIFDSAAIWGHNEMDLGVTRRGVWNLERHGEAYRELMGVSEPQSDYDDRLELYGVKGLVLRSAMYFREPNRRVLALQAIQKLADKALTGPSLLQSSRTRPIIMEANAGSVSQNVGKSP